MRQTHTKNCITAHTKFTHDGDIMKSESSSYFRFGLFFIFTATPINNNNKKPNTLQLSEATLTIPHSPDKSGDEQLQSISL
jgi:hypothetical protein